MKIKNIKLALLLFSLLSTESALAYDHGNLIGELKTITISSDVESENEKTLLLTDVFKSIEQNHPKLQGARKERKIASAVRLQKQGAFDPYIKSSNDYIRYNSPSNRGVAADATDNDLSVNYLTRSGVSIGAGGRYNRGDVKFPLSPTGNAGEYYLDIKAPLLRGLIVNQKSIDEQKALVGEPLADAKFIRERLSLLLESAESYWNWVAAKKTQIIAQDLLNLAESRAKIVEERFIQGDEPEILAFEAKNEVYKRREDLIKFDRAFQNTAFNLSLFLWDSDGMPNAMISAYEVPTNIDNPIEFTDEYLDQGVKLAIMNRPELKALNLEMKITDLDLKLAKNQLLPQVDLVAGPGIDTGGSSIGPTVKAGVEVTLPLRRREAKGKVQASTLKLEKLDLDQRLALQQIIIEVQDVVSEVNAVYQRYLVALEEMKLARKLEEGEREKFKFGDSTLFLVNSRERASAEAQIKLIDLLVKYQKSVLLYKAITAQL